jgi:3-oxoacyl-(acyl-carrier-protein) synthase
MKVYITGLGAVSSIGLDVKSNFNSLQKEQHGIAYTQYIDTYHKTSLPVGEVKLSNDELIHLLQLPTNSPYSRTELLSFLAAQQAYNQANLNAISQRKRIAFISGSSVGGMDLSEKYYKRYAIENEHQWKSYFQKHGCYKHTETFAKAYNIKGLTSTISTACSSGANAMIYGARLIQSGQADVVIAGGVDALAKFTMNGFNSLKILDTELCRPYDDTRVGLNLGEGAGYVVLESEQSVQARSAKVYGSLIGYANTCDAYHQTASSPEGKGAILAMTKALTMAGLAPEKIDYINVHGTGTVNNDVSEGTALQSVFQNGVPSFSSTKAYTGHTLGASGGIEAVYACLAMQHQVVLPNLRFQHRIADLTISPQLKFETKKVEHVLSNSFGFGGNNSTLIFAQ